MRIFISDCNTVAYGFSSVYGIALFHWNHIINYFIDYMWPRYLLLTAGFNNLDGFGSG